jgi:EAL domain-containing protein (putative c-di-GMP-specific phosphodiesterase class I)
VQSGPDRDAVVTQLLDHVRHLERNNYGWRAAHLRLSKLKGRNRRDYQLRLAVNEFDPLLRRDRSELFQLGDGDIVYLWNAESADDVEQVVRRLRLLFSDDPLVSDGKEEATENGEYGDLEPRPTGFCSWYDLERDYYDFHNMVEGLIDERSSNERTRRSAEKPLDPNTLAHVEHTLASFDVSSLVRRQPVCALLPGQQPQPVFSEVHIGIVDMAKQLVPGVDLASDPWLFQHLAETLDRRLLQSLIEHGPTEQAISVNLRMATLLSPEFLEFDKQVRQRSRGELIIELQLVDIFAELGAYMFIRDYARKRGYRILIDGLHHLHLPLINRKRLGADLVKVVWSSDLLEESGEGPLDDLRAAIRTTGVDRVILCRCDSDRAIEFGQSLGLRLFQGYYLDSRLRAQRAPAVAVARTALRSRAG